MDKFFYNNSDEKVYFNGRDYWEDAHLKDGNHLNICVDCGNEFYGHSGRLLCKVCKKNYPGG
jgi:hypothetical protein